MLLFHTNMAFLREQAVLPRADARAARFGSPSIALFVMLFVVLAAQLIIRVQIIEQSYRLEQLRPMVMKNDGRLRELRFEYSRITRPGVLSERATKELRMNPLAPESIRSMTVGRAAEVKK